MLTAKADPCLPTYTASAVPIRTPLANLVAAPTPMSSRCRRSVVTPEACSRAGEFLR
jgi:hypothetical protein